MKIPSTTTLGIRGGKRKQRQEIGDKLTTYRPKRTIRVPKRFIQTSSTEEAVNQSLSMESVDQIPLTTEEIVDGLINPDILLSEEEVVANRMTVRVHPDEPPIEEALASIEANDWLAAMESEKESLYAMDVVEECILPPGRKAIKCRWVLRRKRDEHGHVARYKARLVAKGYSQIPGQDFLFTFAPVAKWDSIRLVMCIATILDLELHHLDVKTAYLNGKLDEELYMEIPPELGTGVWRLKKGLYGLRQSGRQWYMCIHKVYTELGYTRCESDWCVYWRRRNGILVIIAMSVDDLLLAAGSVAERDKVIKELSERFDISDQGEAHWILGCRVTRDRKYKTLKIDQEQYTTSILNVCERLNLGNCNGVGSPMEPNKRLTSEMCPKDENERRKLAQEPYSHYRELVGKLMYLATCTRPDIAFAVRECAKFMSNFGSEHFAALKRIIKYLAKTRTLGIAYSAPVIDASLNFRVFSDSDWAQGEGRKSISGYVVEMANGPIAWSSKQQAVVALSSCEAEYLATTHAAKQALWTRSILTELDFAPTRATPLLCDNRGTVHCAHDPQHHSAMKHIDLRIHFIRDCVNKKLIDVNHIPGIDNYADVCTKPLGPLIQGKWTHRLGMR
jgi:hypothetical protein